MRRVVITGMGVITPLGDKVDELFRSQLAGESGVGPITHFDASTFPTRIAAEVKGFDLSRYVSDPGVWKYVSDASRFTAAASRIALDDAGLMTGADRGRFGVYLGTGEATQEVPFLLEVVARTYQPELRE